ncbi:MAG: hypothetical protein EBR82_65440 [Caulobacteraceae bacterium]|nr:hypothetical protein [Caulobacteraceae bacterium]
MRSFIVKNPNAPLPKHIAVAKKKLKLNKKQVASLVESNKEESYSKFKLKKTGLWDANQKNKLTVRRISDLSDEEKRDMGLV